jgi:biotin synthase
MGETFEDRLDMRSPGGTGGKSIPVNALMPIPGTAYENLPQLTEDEILRTIAMFRFLTRKRNPAGRRKKHDDGFRKKGVPCRRKRRHHGDLLTTCGNSIEEDKEMLIQMGFLIKSLFFLKKLGKSC